LQFLASEGKKTKRIWRSLRLFFATIHTHVKSKVTAFFVKAYRQKL